MLIKRAVLDRVVAGEVDLIFRRWAKPTVKTGGRLRTSVGMLDIVAVDKVAKSQLTTADASRAGFKSLAALRRELESRDTGDFYRIEVRHGGEDPRIALRSNADLSDADVSELITKLDKMDARSNEGPWTRQTMRLLAENPKVRAQDLAESIGRVKKPFKADVAKLKRLGLTISHSPGYELSPRGKALLTHL